MTRPAIRIGIVLVVALALTAAFAVAGGAADPRFTSSATLAPSPVEAGANVLYEAQWTYLDTNQTLTHPFVEITVPAGWTLVEAAPVACNQEGAGAPITCPRATIRRGDVVNQEVELRTSAAQGSKAVTSSLVFYEGPANPGRQNRVPNDSNGVTMTDVIDADDADEPNKAGKCVGEAGGTVSTATGVGGSATSADVPETDELCTPVSIEERGRSNPDEACLADFVCQTDIVTTNAGDVGTTDPIVLTLTFYGRGLNTNLPLIFISNVAGGLQVPECTGDGATPDPCIQSSRSRQQSLTRVVRWSGLDPTWTD